jgi:hypothetical protein
MHIKHVPACSHDEYVMHLVSIPAITTHGRWPSYDTIGMHKLNRIMCV